MFLSALTEKIFVERDNVADLLCWMIVISWVKEPDLTFTTAFLSKPVVFSETLKDRVFSPFPDEEDKTHQDWSEDASHDIFVYMTKL